MKTMTVSDYYELLEDENALDIICPRAARRDSQRASVQDSIRIRNLPESERAQLQSRQDVEVS